MRLFLTIYWLVAAAGLTLTAWKSKRNDRYFFALICLLFGVRSVWKLLHD